MIVLMTRNGTFIWKPTRYVDFNLFNQINWLLFHILGGHDFPAIFGNYVKRLGKWTTDHVQSFKVLFSQSRYPD